MMLPPQGMFCIEMETPSEWVEPVYDHVHHGRAFLFLEKGRIALLEHLGIPNQAYLDRGLALVISSVQASYKRELKGGVVTVTCDSIEVKDRSIIIKQRLLNSRGKVAVEAVIESVFMDIAARRGITPPDDFFQALKRWPGG